MNQVNSDDTLNEDGFRNHVKNNLANEDFKKAIADDAATKCIEEAKANGDKKINNCAIVSTVAGMCIQREFFKGKAY